VFFAKQPILGGNEADGICYMNGKMTDAHKIVFGKHKGKGPLARTRRRSRVCGRLIRK
jgi:hypothetical protein